MEKIDDYVDDDDDDGDDNNHKKTTNNPPQIFVLINLFLPWGSPAPQLGKHQIEKFKWSQILHIP